MTTNWLDALRQTEHWTTKDGRELALEAMTEGHRANLVAMYYRKARRLKLAHDAKMIRAVCAGAPVLVHPDGSSMELLSDGVSDMLDAEIDELPAVWLDRQPLIRRLRELNELEADR